MSEFIEKINTADRLTRMFHEARLTALRLEEELIGLGFFNIEFGKRDVWATYGQAKLRLGDA